MDGEEFDAVVVYKMGYFYAHVTHKLFSLHAINRLFSSRNFSIGIGERSHRSQVHYLPVYKRGYFYGHVKQTVFASCHKSLIFLFEISHWETAGEILLIN